MASKAYFGNPDGSVSSREAADVPNGHSEHVSPSKIPKL